MSKDSYIPRQERKKILLLSDDLRLFSGVGTMAKEIVVNTCHHFNWVNLGAGIHHPEAGQVIDYSSAIAQESGVEDAQVIVRPSEGYGTSMKLRQILAEERPDAIMLFTDPRYWDWLFRNMEREIRMKIPILYYNIWDDLPYPMYNKSYYKSCDGLFAISKQTYNINRVVLGEDADNHVIRYIPHGVSKKYFPVEDQKVLDEFKKRVLGEYADSKFVLFYNARNLGRKKPADIIVAWDTFCRNHPAYADHCCLLMHTAIVDNNGTDLGAVFRDLCSPDTKVVIDEKRYTTEELNLMYNISDGVILASSNEGWGLSLTEALLTGKMIIAPVSGGMQDQMRFQTGDGNWIKFSKDFPSNHTGRLSRVCGTWAIPMFPDSRHLAGSPKTPYIYDDQVDILNIVKAITRLYEYGPDSRQMFGNLGREWAMSGEAGFTGEIMGRRMIEAIEDTITFHKEHPRTNMEFLEVSDREPTRVDYDPVYYHKGEEA